MTCHGRGQEGEMLEGYAANEHFSISKTPCATSVYGHVDREYIPLV